VNDNQLRATASQFLRLREQVYHLPCHGTSTRSSTRSAQLAIVEQLLADLGLSERQCAIIAYENGQCLQVISW
jgi:hypothetical protein